MSRTSAPRRALLAVGASALALAAFASPAFAQTAARADENISTGEELVVTAEKREQSLQDVPVAVSAYT